MFSYRKLTSFILLRCRSTTSLPGSLARKRHGCEKTFGKEIVYQMKIEKYLWNIRHSIFSRRNLLCSYFIFLFSLKHLNPNLNVNNKNSEGLTPLLLVTRDLDLFDASKSQIHCSLRSRLSLIANRESQILIRKSLIVNVFMTSSLFCFQSSWMSLLRIIIQLKSSLCCCIKMRKYLWLSEVLYEWQFSFTSTEFCVCVYFSDCTVVDKEGRSALHLTARNHGTNARNIISLLARKDSLDVGKSR